MGGVRMIGALAAGAILALGISTTAAAHHDPDHAHGRGHAYGTDHAHGPAVPGVATESQGPAGVSAVETAGPPAVPPTPTPSRVAPTGAGIVASSTAAAVPGETVTAAPPVGGQGPAGDDNPALRTQSVAVVTGGSLEAGTGSGTGPLAASLDPSAAEGSNGGGGFLVATGAELRRVAPAGALLVAVGVALLLVSTWPSSARRRRALLVLDESGAFA